MFFSLIHHRNPQQEICVTDTFKINAKVSQPTQQESKLLTPFLIALYLFLSQVLFKVVNEDQKKSFAVVDDTIHPAKDHPYVTQTPYGK